MSGRQSGSDPDALEGYLPERYPLILYGRDRPEPPAGARVLARDSAGYPALFQVGANALGFTGHPGVKPAIIEDLVMEFEEGPAEAGAPSRRASFAAAQYRRRAGADHDRGGEGTRADAVKLTDATYCQSRLD